MVALMDNSLSNGHAQVAKRHQWYMQGYKLECPGHWDMFGGEQACPGSPEIVRGHHPDLHDVAAVDTVVLKQVCSDCHISDLGYDKCAGRPLQATLWFP